MGGDRACCGWEEDDQGRAHLVGLTFELSSESQGRADHP